MRKHESSLTVDAKTATYKLIGKQILVADITEDRCIPDEAKTRDQQFVDCYKVDIIQLEKAE